MLAWSLTLVALTAGAADAPRSVVDCYQQLPEKLFPGEHKYELTHSKNGWSTHSAMTDDKIVVTVDTKNGFIEFSDEGTGGGDTKIQVALFLKEDKTPLLAVSESFSDGLVSSGAVTFAEPVEGRWEKVNDRVLPRFKPEDFLEPRCLNALGSKDTLVNEAIIYSLPRQGTTIQPSLRIARLMLPEDMRDEKSPCPKDNPRALKWDKKAGRFTLEPATSSGKKREP